MQENRSPFPRLSFETSGTTTTTDTATKNLHTEGCPHKHPKNDSRTKEGAYGDVDRGLRFLKKGPVPMAVTPSISILNVIVAKIKNKSMSILILLSSKQNGKKNVETKALLDTGAGGKFIDQNFVL